MGITRILWDDIIPDWQKIATEKINCGDNAVVLRGISAVISCLCDINSRLDDIEEQIDSLRQKQ